MHFLSKWSFLKAVSKIAVLASVMMLFVTGCGMMPSVLMPVGQAMPAAPGQGVVIVSVTENGFFNTDATGVIPWHPQVWFRGVGAQERHSFPGYREAVQLTPISADIPNVLGKLAVLQLPAGDYDVSDWYVVQRDGIVSNTYKPNQTFSMPFHVEAGKAIYLGDIAFKFLEGGNVFGVTALSGIELKVLDAFDRDVPLFKTLYPSLAEMPVEKKLVEYPYEY